MNESSASTGAASPPALIVGALKRAGIALVASLPDQWLAPLIERCAADPEIRHVGVAREDEGRRHLCRRLPRRHEGGTDLPELGGLALGQRPRGMAFHHQIPMLIVAAHRGCHDDNQYYQMYKGRVTEPVLAAMGLPHHVIDGPEHLGLIEQGARQSLLSRLPLVLLLRRRALVG
jgi:sulfopyruvate decarboxylase subunit alpha